MKKNVLIELLMGILAIWCLTEAHHSGIIDKMKGE